MKEIGKVIEVKKDLVIVQMERQEACGNCKACKTGQNENEMLATAKNLCNAKENDFVTLYLENNNFLKAVLIAYGFPLIFLLGGFLLGLYFFETEILSFLVGIIFMIIAYLIIKNNEKNLNKENYIPVATEIVKNK